MALTFNNCNFDQTKQVLDGASFSDCKFTRCVIVYAGGPLPSLVRCGFFDCRWEFDAGAARTVAFLTAMVQGGLGGIVDVLLEEIKAGVIPALESTPRGPSEAKATEIRE